jgi:hypothetical protein
MDTLSAMGKAPSVQLYERIAGASLIARCYLTVVGRLAIRSNFESLFAELRLNESTCDLREECWENSFSLRQVDIEQNKRSVS